MLICFPEQIINMPTINVNRDRLFKLLEHVYTDDEFDQLCFDFGIELDEVTSEKEQISKEQGDAKSGNASDSIIYKIEVPANRLDLLCIEGLVQSLKVFLQQSSIPKYQCIQVSESCHKLIMKGDTQKIRKFCVGAILRNVSLTKDIYESFIDLQDKLHHNIGRRRTLVSIGTHDLDTIKGPFIYDAKPPQDIKFVALNQVKEQTALELMELYSKDSHLKAFLPIIKDSPVYPVIYDQNGIVLSMPPIINGDHSKIKLSTKNIFIEITATDLTKAKMTLDTLVCMFSGYCKKSFTVEVVDVIYPSGKVLTTPELFNREEHLCVDVFNKKIGINIDAENAATLLTRMCLESEVVNKEIGEVKIIIPPTRGDIIHACDIIEDVAIAYGFNNIIKTFPLSVTVGSQQVSMKLSERLRIELAAAGFTEALTFSLCAEADIGKKMRQSQDKVDKLAVRIANPKTLDFQVVRTSLLPGLLKTIASNRRLALPIKLFEVQEVVLKDGNCETGARNERRLAAVHYNNTPGFEIVHGLLDRVMQVLEVPYNPANKEGYYIRGAEDSSFLKQRCADVVWRGEVIGKLGVLHPDVVGGFDLPCPAAALEINLEKFYCGL